MWSSQSASTSVARFMVARLTLPAARWYDPVPMESGRWTIDNPAGPGGRDAPQLSARIPPQGSRSSIDASPTAALTNSALAMAVGNCSPQPGGTVIHSDQLNSPSSAPGHSPSAADLTVIRSGLQVGGQAVLLGGTGNAFLHRLVLVGLLGRRFRRRGSAPRPGWRLRRWCAGGLPSTGFGPHLRPGIFRLRGVPSTRVAAGAGPDEAGDFL